MKPIKPSKSINQLSPEEYDDYLDNLVEREEDLKEDFIQKEKDGKFQIN